MNTIPSVSSSASLGRSGSRLPICGKIRAGIKVLTKHAALQPQAQTLYDQGVAAGVCASSSAVCSTGCNRHPGGHGQSAACRWPIECDCCIGGHGCMSVR